MIILGFNYLGHDASAAILKNGKLIAAIEEERFTRHKKYFGGFPKKFIFINIILTDDYGL